MKEEELNEMIMDEEDLDEINISELINDNSEEMAEIIEEAYIDIERELNNLYGDENE